MVACFLRAISASMSSAIDSAEWPNELSQTNNWPLNSSSSQHIDAYILITQQIGPRLKTQRIEGARYCIDRAHWMQPYNNLHRSVYLSNKANLARAFSFSRLFALLLTQSNMHWHCVATIVPTVYRPSTTDRSLFQPFAMFVLPISHSWRLRGSWGHLHSLLPVFLLGIWSFFSGTVANWYPSNWFGVKMCIDCPLERSPTSL